MGWSTTSDLDRFAAAAGGYLRSHTAENTLLLSTAAQAARSGASARELLYGWWAPSAGGDPRGAFVHDPAVPLLISGRVPEMATALAVTLARLGRRVRGVDAPTAAADAFAAAWSQRASTEVRAHRTCRVYRVTAQPATGAGSPLQGTPPRGMPAAPGGWPRPGVPGPPGSLRVAVPEDRALLAGWLELAAAESAERLAAPSDLAADLISYGGAVFWEVPQKPGVFREAARYLAEAHPRGGEPASQPVAFTTLTRPVAGSARIAMVYTVPERRRNGYATTLIQAVSGALLYRDEPGAAAPAVLGRDRVGEVVMITDRHRPDPWGGRFGYQLVGERAVLRFGPPTGPVPRAKSGPMPRLPTGPLPRVPRPGR